jgi:hypothetical protein
MFLPLSIVAGKQARHSCKTELMLFEFTLAKGTGSLLPYQEKFEAELNLAGGCRSTGDRASGSGKAGRVS